MSVQIDAPITMGSHLQGAVAIAALLAFDEFNPATGLASTCTSRANIEMPPLRHSLVGWYPVELHVYISNYL
jgi:hypothetical protein